MIDRLNEACSGRYTVQRELGRGGMATVFLADGQRFFMARVAGPGQALESVTVVLNWLDELESRFGK